jgi:hypothetical protein
MFDTFIFDTAFFQTTFVFVLLVTITIWQKLKQFAAIMCGLYIIYLIFLIYDSTNIDNSILTNNIDPIITKDITGITLENEIKTVDSDKSLKSLKAPKVNVKLSDNKFSLLTKNIRNNMKDVSIAQAKDNKEQILNKNLVKIKYFKLGRDVKNRELINIDSTFYVEDGRIYCLTTIENQNNGNVIFHNWYQNNKLISKIRMNIGWSYNWRTWSYINVNNKRTGDWKIVVTDSLNIRYDSLYFNIKNNLE